MKSLETPVNLSFEKGNPFFRLITNEDVAPFDNRFTTLHEGMQRVRTYTQLVLEGSQGRPFCPFVSQIEKTNGYSARVYKSAPQELKLPEVIDQMKNEFHRRSPQETSPYIPFDNTVIIGAFAHPEAKSPEFHNELEAIYEASRMRILEAGLLIGYMGPNHPATREDGSSPFTSPIPLIVIDRLHPSHKRFMRNPQEKEIHSHFFPSQRNRCPVNHE